MKKAKINIVIMIISLLFFIGTVGLIISMHQIDKQTEDTTTLYTATVSGVDITDTGENIFAKIHIKEYNTSLHIDTTISKNISMDDVRNLENGQTIFFRIENIKVQQMDKVDFLNITSLKTDKNNIFTLEEYNAFISDSAYPARIAGIITAILFFSISVFCYLKINKTGDGPLS